MDLRGWLGLPFLFLLLFLVGCNSERIGNLTKAEIELKLKGILQLSEISLAESGPSAYTGTGKRLDGMIYKLKVTRKSNELAWETEDEQGNKGMGELGSFP